MKIPPNVQGVLEQVKQEACIKSIWLVGSRANGEYRVNSDWDFICFCEEPINVQAARCDFVDIIRVDNDGRYLLEGQPMEFAGEFASWQWKEIGSDTAYYRNRVTPNVGAGVGFDLSDVKYVTYKAFKVWVRDA